MDLVQGMRVFCAVVDAGSFVKAADQLDISKSAVTAHIAELEHRLTVRLLQRTTRKLSLTDDGAGYLEHCRRVLADIDETIGSLSRGRAIPKGRLRIDTIPSIGIQYLMPALPRFAEQYPEIDVILTLNDQVVDLISESVDVAVRVGQLQDGSYVARRIYESAHVIVAAPGYLERFGTPATADDLEHHNCLGLYFATAGRVMPWVFEHAGARTEWMPNARIAVSSTEAAIPAIVRGAGIGYLADFILGRQLASREVVPILTDYVRRDRLPVSVVYAHNRHLSAKVRAFVDFAVGLFPRERTVVRAHNG